MGRISVVQKIDSAASKFRTTKELRRDDEEATRLKISSLAFEERAKFRWLLFGVLTQLIIAQYAANNLCLAASPIRGAPDEGQRGNRTAPLPKSGPVASKAAGAFAYEAVDKHQEGREEDELAPAEAGDDELTKRLLLANPSQRNLRLLRKLERRQLDYQIFYPNNARATRSQHLEPDTRQRAPATGRNGAKANQVSAAKSGGSNSSASNPNYRTNVVIKAFNYKLRLDLELNNNLFGLSLIQKHFLPKGGQQISTQRLEHCYYHARSQADARPFAIGAFRTCNGLSGIIHVNKESFVVHPFYDTDLSTKHPHIIYRYQFDANQPPGEQPAGGSVRQCGSSRLHEWALRQYNKLAPAVRVGRQSSASCSAEGDSACDTSATGARHDNGSLVVDRKAGSTETTGTGSAETVGETAGKATVETTSPASSALPSPVLSPPRSPDEGSSKSGKLSALSKRDVSLTEKHIELALILSQDMFDKRNSSSRLEVLHDAIQIVNCLDLYFRSANTRVALIYVETWAYGDQIEMSSDVKRTLYNFLEYSARKLYKVSMDAAHLLTGGHARPFDSNEMGMAIPDSICSSRAVSVSQEASVFEPFIAASTMAHMLGHNLGMEHDEAPAPASLAAPAEAPPSPAHSGARQQGSGGGEEDSEDEIKSRSAGPAPASNFEWGAGGERLLEEQLTADTCRGNCLMSERFTYLQPPVSIGNMVQQQVASTGNLSQPGQAIVTMYSGAEPAAPAGPEPEGETAAAAEHHVAASLPFRFSRQSLETYHRQLRLGHGICLFNKPNQLEDFRSCGNGIVDKGEDCDCGSFQECLEQDSCCDPITCRFKADAECINGACCDRCRLRPRGFVCRKARGECDLAEQCDGKASQCAPDVHKQNGLSCAADAGYCHLGQCAQHDAQCAELWGSDARRADRLCFATFNANGTIRGNCGFDAALRKYKRCDQEHLMCGTLHCQLGDMRPVTAPLEGPHGQEFSKKTIHTLEGAHHECKVITGSSQSATHGSSYVRDGSKCGAGRVCFNQTCQPLELVYREAYELCPRDEKGRHCSDNGICSTANRCHCEPGWLGHDCSQRAPPEPAEGPPVAKLPPALVTLHSGAGLAGPLNHMGVGAGQPLTLSPRPTAGPSPVALTGATEASTAAAEAETTTAAAAPTTTGPSNVVQDKKKHDALGAPTLVFILVSIVAAVYVGFALMANCYRRKGFLKPDKVLRHHQMNCKMDAIRSSFIAKRLAEAELGISDAPGPAPQQNGPDMLNSFVSSPAPCQHLHTIYGSQPEAMVPDQMLANSGELPRSKAMEPDAFGQAPQQRLSLGQQISATVHYIDETGAHVDPRSYLLHRNPNESSVAYEPDPGDHIPLLLPADSAGIHAHNKRPMNRPIMRSFITGSFASQQRQQASSKAMSAPRPSLHCSLAMGGTLRAQQVAHNQSLAAHLSCNQLINRATSLGNVNHLRQHPRQNSENQAASDYDEDDEETRRALMAHRALATPLRVGVGRHGATVGYKRSAIEADSCSALSSPEARDPFWSDADVRPAQADKTDYSLARQPVSRPAQRPVGYHEDVISGVISLKQRRSIGGSSQYMSGGKSMLDREAQDGQDTEEDLPLLPPPPPPNLHDGGVDAGSEDDSEPSHSVRANRPSKPKSPVYPTAGSSRTVKRIPLNSGDGGTVEQLSLIAQLQQLERVQSLHQKQVAGDKNFATTTGDGLHEFFSLPLSVQLSALLARSLNEDRASCSTQLDEYLNVLNNTGVANLSRKSFKKSASGLAKEHQMHQQTGSWGKRQQVKLQNLQALINRLQKLHQQTVLQQQLEELNGCDLDEDCTAKGSRHSTLSRSTRARSVSRANQTADDLYQVQQQFNAGERDWNRTTGRTRRTVKDNLGGSKNESIYSMSDSEDGNFVSQMLIYQRNKVQLSTGADQRAVQVSNQPLETNEVNNDEKLDLKRESSSSANANPPTWPSPPAPTVKSSDQEVTRQPSAEIDSIDVKNESQSVGQKQE